MNRTLSEQNVLNKLGISDFRHMMNITVRQSRQSSVASPGIIIKYGNIFYKEEKSIFL